MTMPWLAEMNDGWDAARAAFLAEGNGLAAGLVAAYLGLKLEDPLDARIAAHALRGLSLTRGAIIPGARSLTFSWSHDPDAGAKCWLYPLYDQAAELVEVLAFDVDGHAETDIFSYGEAIDHVGFDLTGLNEDKRVVMFVRSRVWLRYWIKRLREREAARSRFYTTSPASCGALIVRPAAVNFAPVRRSRAAWADGVEEVVVADKELGERVQAAFAAAAVNALPELKVVGKGGQG